MLGDLLQKTTGTLTLYPPYRSDNVHTELVFFLVTRVPIPDPANLRPPMGGDHKAVVLPCLAVDLFEGERGGTRAVPRALISRQQSG